MTAGTRRVALTVLLALTGGAVSVADELVTRDGQVIVTQGPWETRGKLLVFKLADGTLASLRLDEADLEASERRAREAVERRAREARRVEAPVAEPRQAVMVLTDRDVAHAPNRGEEPESEGGAGDAEAAFAADAAAGTEGAGDQGSNVDSSDTGSGESDAAAGSPVATTSGRGVQVVQWSQEADGEDGVAVRGVIQNMGSTFATSLAVNALFYDEGGALLAAREVQFEDGPLGPGARRNFSVSLPHTLIYDEIKFQVVGRGFRSVGQSVRTGEAQEPDTFDVP